MKSIMHVGFAMLAMLVLGACAAPPGGGGSTPVAGGGVEGMLRPLCDSKDRSNIGDSTGCWQVVSNMPGCYVNGIDVKVDSVTWTGGCVNKKIEGEGTLIWDSSWGYSGEITGLWRNGRDYKVEFGNGVWFSPQGTRYRYTKDEGKKGRSFRDRLVLTTAEREIEHAAHGAAFREGAAFGYMQGDEMPLYDEIPPDESLLATIAAAPFLSDVPYVIAFPPEDFSFMLVFGTDSTGACGLQVGKYTSVHGAENDAERIYELLTNKYGVADYGDVGIESISTHDWDEGLAENYDAYAFWEPHVEEEMVHGTAGIHLRASSANEVARGSYRERAADDETSPRMREYYSARAASPNRVTIDYSFANAGVYNKTTGEHEGGCVDEAKARRESQL